MVTNDGVKNIFGGMDWDMTMANKGYENTYWYEFRDLDGDQIMEIIQTGEECSLAFSAYPNN